MTARLQCEDGVLRDPIVLLLHNEHYRTITSPKDIPKSWKSATPKGVVSRGAGKSVKSFSSWLKPASVIHARQSSNQKNTSCSWNSTSRQSWLKPRKIFKASSSKAESQATDSVPSASSHKQSDQTIGEHSSIPERRTWICPLCSVEIASVGNRAKLGWTRGSHLRDRHPNIERASVAGLKSQSQETCAVSYNLPAHAVGWSCPWCKAQLPRLERHALASCSCSLYKRSSQERHQNFKKRHGGKLEILFCKYVVTMQTSKLPPKRLFVIANPMAICWPQSKSIGQHGHTRQPEIVILLADDDQSQKKPQRKLAHMCHMLAFGVSKCNRQKPLYQEDAWMAQALRIGKYKPCCNCKSMEHISWTYQLDLLVLNTCPETMVAWLDPVRRCWAQSRPQMPKQAYLPDLLLWNLNVRSSSAAWEILNLVSLHNIHVATLQEVRLSSNDYTAFARYAYSLG